jgi:hypothetical protein
MLDSTIDSVNSLLKRARASLQRQLSTSADREPAPAPDSPSEQATVAEFVRAYESGDLDALVALLTDDVFLSMPPFPLEYEGRDVVARFYASMIGSGGGSTSYRREPTVSRRSGPTSARRPASATGPASSSSPSRPTGSARSPASTPACFHGSGCRDRSLTDSQLPSGLGIADVSAQRQRPDVLDGRCEGVRCAD